LRNIVEKSELWVFKVKQASEKKSKKQSDDAESKVNILTWVHERKLQD
jgi:hypothetical protein